MTGAGIMVMYLEQLHNDSRKMLEKEITVSYNEVEFQFALE